MEQTLYGEDADIRLLTLYKQHYLNSYGPPLKCHFSSWGYYDGISILSPKETTQRLFEKRTNSPISELWYGSMDYTENFQGRYSNQSIGIFRNKSEAINNFWKNYNQYPFFAVSFLQLDKTTRLQENPDEVLQVVTGEIEKIEGEKSFEGSTPMAAETVEIVVYYTFDSADLVVLMQGNKLEALEDALYRIENMDVQCYSHSIMGIAEKYLERCVQEKATEWNQWNNQNCFLDDDIQQISIKIVTSGKEDVEEKLKENLKKSICVGKIFSSHVAGHENLSIEIQNTKVRSLIKLLCPGGFLTHQNPLYGQGLYNLETSVAIKKREWGPYKEQRVEEEADNSEHAICTSEQKEISETGDLSTEVAPDSGQGRSWCEKKIENYKKLLKEAREEKDESLSSYYYALLQTLNTIAQYENFTLARDIFYLIFPAFELFDQQLKRAKEKTKEQPFNEKVVIEEIKEGMRNFLNSVDSIIYHTIHTDQIYLMIPGYTGTVFSIPIKLCLLYQWFIHQIIDLLNDSHRKDNGKPFLYQCLFTPEMESRPTTDIISMGLPHGDRLIRVKLSQRSLYMPRDLFIILTHEIAHYVGEDIRCRKVRADRIICTIATILAHEIVSLDSKESIINRFPLEFQRVRAKLKNYIEQEATKRIENISKGAYYASNIKVSLPPVIEGILLDENREISKILNELPQAIFPKEVDYLIAEKRAKNSVEAKKILLKELYRIEEKFEENRKLILLYEISGELVYKLSSIYKEVFSDMAAYSILDFDSQTYEEAFYISEGRPIIDPEIEQEVRENILRIIKAKETGQATYPFSQKQPTGEFPEREDKIYKRIRNSLYNYDCTRANLFAYANVCYQKIKSHLDSKSDLKKEVQNLFKIFTGEKELNCLKIYFEICTKTFSYKKNVKEMLENSLNQEA